MKESNYEAALKACDTKLEAGGKTADTILLSTPALTQQGTECLMRLERHKDALKDLEDILKCEDLADSDKSQVRVSARD